MATTSFEPWVIRLLAWLDWAGSADDAASLADHPPGGPGPAPEHPLCSAPNQPDAARESAPDFNALALELFALQFLHVEPYRRYCEHLGQSPDCVSNWSAIPCIPAAGFKEFDLTSLPAQDRRTVFHSSGTTGHHPGRHYHSPASLELYERSLRPWFARHLLPDRPRMRILSLVPPASQAPNSSLAHMLTTVLRHHGTSPSLSAGRVGPDGIWSLDLDRILAELESACTNAEPLLLTGTAFGFVHLLDALSKRRLRTTLPAGSRLMETGGYKGRSRALSKTALHSALTRTLGIPEPHIVSEYGMSELSSQAYDRPVGGSPPRRFRFPPWCAWRVISPETGQSAALGETGLLQVIDLANAFSVLAVQTEDLAIAREDGFDYAGRARAAEGRGCSLMHP